MACIMWIRVNRVPINADLEFLPLGRISLLPWPTARKVQGTIYSYLRPTLPSEYLLPIRALTVFLEAQSLTPEPEATCVILKQSPGAINLLHNPVTASV